MSGGVTEDRNLGRAASLGAAWLFGLRVVDQLIKLIRLVIVARLVLPSEFGLLGVALLALAAFQTFSETGIRQALIQRTENPQDEFHPAWSLQLLRGFVLGGVLFLAAPWIAQFFESPAAAPVIRWLSLLFLLDGVSNIATVEFQRELNFDRQFAMQISGTIADFSVTVVLAYLWRDVYALVFGLLAGQLVQTIAGYLLRPHRPRWVWDLQRFSALWTYGRWVAGSTILLFLGNQGDDMVVGKVLGVASLAFYQLAYRVASLPATELSRLVSSVLFPALSRLQSQTERMRRAYLQALQFTSTVAFPIAAAILLLAPGLTVPILGEAWAPAIVPMQILGVCGLFRSVVGPGPLYMAAGRPQVKVQAQALGFAALALTVLPLTWRWGIAGAAVAASLRPAVGNGWLLVRAWRDMPELRGGTARGLGIPAAASTIATLAAWGAATLWPIATDGSAELSLTLFRSGMLLCLLLGGYYLCLSQLDRRTGGSLVRVWVQASDRVRQRKAGQQGSET